jgi:hypothetical protein
LSRNIEPEPQEVAMGIDSPPCFCFDRLKSQVR